MKSSFILAVSLAFIGVAAVLILPAVAAPSVTFTVNSTLDLVDSNPGNGVCQAANGACTLRAAIQEANATAAHDTIILPAGTYALTITGQSENAAAQGDLDILNDLTIQGSGASTTIVDARKIDRVIEITSTAQVTLTDLTIRNGYDNGYAGGGILAEGTLTLIDDRLTTNFSSANGGAISSQKTLMLINTDVISNSSWFGGGIRAAGPLTITGGQILSNAASASGGGLHALSSMLLSGTLLRGNHADGPSSGSGGAINFAGSRLELTDVTLISNTAHLEGGGLTSSNGTTSLNNVIISGNVASDGLTHGEGGGIRFRGTSMLELNDVTLDRNLGTSAGGGIFTEGPIRLNRVTLSNNRGGSFGGALFISGTTTLVVMTNTTISGNSLDAGAGGGIYNVGTLSMTNATVVSNTAPAFGSAIYNAGPLYTRNTIIAKSPGSVQACNGTMLTSLGHNLDNDGTCGLTATGDLSNTNPLLDALRNNGGATWTHALLPTSPAIDHGDNAGCPDRDQRGVLRPLDGDGNGSSICDIGAYEYGTPRAVYLPVVMK